jgi:hypothetical protein
MALMGVLLLATQIPFVVLPFLTAASAFVFLSFSSPLRRPGVCVWSINS